MKKPFIFLIALILGFTLKGVFGQLNWTLMGNMPGSYDRQYEIAFSIGDKGYYGLGTGGMGGGLSDLWEYNSNVNDWTQKTSYPSANGLYCTAYFVIGSKAYVATGRQSMSASINEVWEYNPSSDTWTQKANFPGGIRQSSVGFSIGNKGYLFGGCDISVSPHIYYKDIWEYDASSDSWTQKANFPGAAREGASAFTIGSVGYVIGGRDGNNYYQDLYQYNPTSNQWTQKVSYNGGQLAYAGGIGFNNYGYVGGGEMASLGTRTDMWRYNPNNNEWIQMNTAVSYFNQHYFTIGNVCYADLNNASNYKAFYKFTSNVSINDIKKSDLMLYPNPTTDLIFFTLPENFHSNYLISIYNNLGQLVDQIKGTALYNNCIDFSKVPKGLYIVKITGDEVNLSNKVLKQ